MYILATDKETVLKIFQQQLGTQVKEDKLAEVADALLTPNGEWEEVTNFEPELGFNFAGFVECEDICFLASEIKKGTPFRLFKKKT